MSSKRTAFFRAGAIGVAAAAAGCVSPADRASLASLEGSAALAGLSARVEVERDEIGATRYLAGSLVDAVRAQGYVHAQERFVQMDALRRLSSGRLAALVGGPGVESDRRARTTGYHLAAARALSALDPAHRLLLESYTAGVNAGLEALGAPPPEHRILGVEPEPWEAIDCLHVAYSLSASLLTGASSEDRVATLREAYAFAPEIADFLLPRTTRFDSLIGGGSDYEPASIPPAPGKQAPLARAGSVAFGPERPALGSNNWAVSGARTSDGRAILAGDMHLSLTMPPVWRHEQLNIGDRSVVGVALPGTPGIVAGSNGEVAWAFTNVTGDFEDLAALEVHPDDPERHRGAGGAWLAFGEREERIEVRGGIDQAEIVRVSEWGPVVGEDRAGRPLALRRGDMDPEPINFDLLDMPGARSLEEAIDVLRGWRGPPQNAVVASRDGRIAWVMTGFIPDRVGTDGSAPIDLAAGEGWRGGVEGAARPSVVDPAGGAIVTANHRTLPLGDAETVGTRWELGARAGRIRALLDSRGEVGEGDMLEIQLDTASPVYAALMPFVLGAIEPDDENQRLRYARGLIESWDGTASEASESYRLVRWVARTLVRETVSPLLEPAAALDPSWTAGSDLAYVEPALRLLEEKPLAHLPSPHETWRGFVRWCVIRAMDDIRASPEDARLDAPWGERNRLDMRHPMSGALPWLRGELDMPEHPQPGDVVTVRVAAPTLGASQRMVVSPGNEEDGIFHMPGGQSGHPLSPFYRAGHGAWRDGAARPLLPGRTAHRLTLTPAASSRD